MFTTHHTERTCWKKRQLGLQVISLPIYRLRKVVLPFNSDVRVPLANNPHVLLKHPPVASGDTKHRQGLSLKLNCCVLKSLLNWQHQYLRCS